MYGNSMASLLLDGDMLIARTDRPARQGEAAVIKLWRKDEVMARIWFPSADRTAIDLMSYGEGSHQSTRISPSEVEWALDVLAVVRVVMPR
jgi:hypothetical protein